LVIEWRGGRSNTGGNVQQPPISERSILAPPYRRNSLEHHPGIEPGPVPGTEDVGLQRRKPPPRQPDQARVLELLAEFFCLRTNDAAELLRNHAITESDKRSVRCTLSILHRDGFLYRAPHFDFGHERGGVAYVYGLSAKGRRLRLAERVFDSGDEDPRRAFRSDAGP
jgi:hypothetical protein